jgi:hypothetical protein
MTASLYHLFAWAIEDRRQIFCTYDGYRREMCPIILGHSDGRAKALVWQFGGETSKGRDRGLGWKCLFLAGITNAKLVEGEWKAGSRHQQNQSCISDVDYDANPTSPYYPTHSLGELRGTLEPSPG